MGMTSDIMYVPYYLLLKANIYVDMKLIKHLLCTAKEMKAQLTD
jgi:hypothetical protein